MKEIDLLKEARNIILMKLSSRKEELTGMIKDPAFRNSLSVDELYFLYDSFYKLPVDILELPVREYNGLQKMKILTIGDLLEKTPQDIQNIRNFGKKSVSNIRNILRQFGIFLRGDSDIYEEPEEPAKELTSEELMQYGIYSEDDDSDIYKELEEPEEETDNISSPDIQDNYQDGMNGFEITEEETNSLPIMCRAYRENKNVSKTVDLVISVLRKLRDSSDELLWNYYNEDNFITAGFFIPFLKKLIKFIEKILDSLYTIRCGPEYIEIFGWPD